MKFFKEMREKHPNECVLVLVFVLLFILMSILSPGKFLTPINLQTMAYQMPEFGLMALAMMIAILTGGINLSICTGATLSGIIAGLFMTSTFGQNNPGLATVLGVILIVIVSCITGVINGWLIAYIGVAAMLVTLGTRMVFEGYGLQLTKGGSVSGFPEAFLNIGTATIVGIPVSMIVFVLVIILSYFLFERSKWGNEVYMIGCNETASRFSGIKTKRVLLLVYVYSGFCYGISGVLIASRYCSAKTDYGSSYLMQALTAVVLGGTSIAGGSGTVSGTVIAVLIIQVLSTGLNIFGVNRYVVNIITGAILVLILAIRYVTNAVIDKRKVKARALAASQAKK